MLILAILKRKGPFLCDKANLDKRMLSNQEKGRIICGESEFFLAGVYWIEPLGAIPDIQSYSYIVDIISSRGPTCMENDKY